MSSSIPSTTAPGEHSLSTLLRTLTTTTSPETFLFATIPSHPNLFSLLSGMPIQSLFREAEGWTVILPQDAAASIGLEGHFPCKMITLNVHSSLEAVGFLAAVARRVAEEVGVGCNAVSGFYHDHLFVPVGKEQDVVKVLERIAEEAKEVEGKT